jgi:hypothetical protein
VRKSAGSKSAEADAGDSKGKKSKDGKKAKGGKKPSTGKAKESKHKPPVSGSSGRI